MSNCVGRCSLDEYLIQYHSKDADAPLAAFSLYRTCIIRIHVRVGIYPHTCRAGVPQWLFHAKEFRM